MLVQDILKKIRFTLSDLDGSRWTDERLISLIDDCISALTRKTILFTSVVYVKLVNNIVEYDLSSIAAKIIRVEYEKKPLTSFSHYDMDKRNPDWQKDEGPKIKAIIFDKQREAIFKLYPVLKNENVLFVGSNISYSGDYGIITGIAYSEIPLVLSGDFGDISPITDDGYIKVFYIKKYVSLNDINDTVDISQAALDLVKHYVVGMALRDNQDTQSRIIAKEELDMYEKTLEDYTFEKAKNFSQSSYTVPYNPIG